MLSSTDQLQVLRIGRSKVVIDPLGRILFHHLYSGGFFRAGYQFGWLWDSVDPTGLGVNFKVLYYANLKRLNLRLFLKDDFTNAYEAYPKAFLDFSMKHRAFISIKGVLIYVASLSLFKIVPSDYSAVVELLVGLDGREV